VLIAPAGSPALKNFEGLRDAQVRHIAVGEPRSVPVGEYAKQALTSMGFLEAVKDKLVFANDVRQVLTYVEREDAEAGFVYQSDARSSTKVRIVAVAPAESHKPIVYCAAIIKETRQQDAAKRFLDFLGADTAQKIFTALGFELIK
jgi:molybdate transport system substrate-binding protein